MVREVLTETAASEMFADRLTTCVGTVTRADRRPWTRARIDRAGSGARRAVRARGLHGRLRAAAAAAARDEGEPVKLRAWAVERVYGSKAQLQLDFEQAERKAEKKAELLELLGSCYNLPRKVLRIITNN